MDSTSRPDKFLVPFARDDSARVEVPATTTDPGAFSQTLGSPPQTGLPVEAGGTPPRLEDFNGAMNQLSRAIWWVMSGNRFPFDAAWTADTEIGGYARGAVLPAALGSGVVGLGEWYNNADNNSANPDTVGTDWVPGYHYGATSLTGQTGGTVTLTPAQGAKTTILVAGALTSNLVLVVPAWVYSWTIYNNTSGAFTVTVKTATSSAVAIPQTGMATDVRCDGTNVSVVTATVGTLTAGNGLTGGGSMTSDRTIALGTPSSVTSTSTNTASGTTHTHALDSTGVAAASYGSTSLTAGTAPVVPYFTVDAKGRLTAAGQYSIGTAASYAIGTSAATVPLLSTANTWSQLQTVAASGNDFWGMSRNGYTFTFGNGGDGTCFLTDYVNTIQAWTYSSVSRKTGFVGGVKLGTYGGSFLQIDFTSATTAYMWGTSGAGDNIGFITRVGSSSYTWNWNGAMQATGGFQPSSSRELKTDLQPNPYGLAAVLQLETTLGKYCDWFNNDGLERVFHIAENVAEVMPPVAAGPGTLATPPGESEARAFKGYSIEQMLAVHTKAIQDLHALIQAQQAIIDRLTKESNA